MVKPIKLTEEEIKYLEDNLNPPGPLSQDEMGMAEYGKGLGETMEQILNGLQFSC